MAEQVYPKIYSDQFQPTIDPAAPAGTLFDGNIEDLIQALANRLLAATGGTDIMANPATNLSAVATELAAQSNVQAYLELGRVTSDQVFTDAIFTDMLYNATVDHWGTEHIERQLNESGINIVTSGVYLVTAQGRWGLSSVGGRKIALVFSGTPAHTFYHVPAQGTSGYSVSTVRYLPAGTGVSAKAEQTSGANLGQIRDYQKLIVVKLGGRPA